MIAETVERARGPSTRKTSKHAHRSGSPREAAASAGPIPATSVERAKLDPSICLVAQIGRLCAQLGEAYAASELAQRAAREKSVPDEFFIEETREHLYDREYDLRQAAPHLLAQSFEGAMFQVAVASHLLDDLLSLDLNDACEKRKAEERLRGAGSCLYSVLRVLETACGADRRAAGVAGSMSDFLDPHTRVERALQGHHEMDPRRMTEDEAPYPATAVRSILSGATRNASEAAGDPVFELIETHKALWDAQEAISSDDGTNPKWLKAVDQAYAVMIRLAETPATTLEGCIAVATYVASHPSRAGNTDLDEAAVDGLAASLRGLSRRLEAGHG
jgi:hypothetical protein